MPITPRTISAAENSRFLKESCDNRDYNAAAHYLNELINSVPTAPIPVQTT